MAKSKHMGPDLINPAPRLSSSRNHSVIYRKQYGKETKPICLSVKEKERKKAPPVHLIQLHLPTQNIDPFRLFRVTCSPEALDIAIRTELTGKTPFPYEVPNPH